MAIINQPTSGGAPGGAAGGDLGGTYPNPTVTGGTHLTAASVPIASLADPTTGKVIGSSGGAAAAVNPPGFEFGYDQITSLVNITATVEANATALITCAAHTFDGSPVLLHVYFPDVRTPGNAAGDIARFSLFESTTEIGVIGLVITPVAHQVIQSAAFFYRFTPTAASHTYIIAGSCNTTTSTPAAGGGAAGTATEVPAFARFTKI